MSEFHYVRTLGEDGGVDAVDGPAEGMSLNEILKDGLPPFKVALEIISALCEILDIAEQDEEGHGAIDATRVFLDDVGAVSVEGYGADRAKCPAPEGAYRGSATDVYGLGRVAYALFTPRDFPELSYDDPDTHDDAVIDSVIQINFDGLQEDMVGDIQWFLCKFLSFDREDRPAALDAWRTFIAFADEAEGEFIEDWSVEAMEGGGNRRDRDAAMTRDVEGEKEDLGGPSIKKGPLGKGAISFGGGGGKSGQATAFWSVKDMKAALEREEEEEEEDGFRPSVGGGAATSFWTKEQLQSMREGTGDAPRPKRGGSGGNAGERLSERPQTMFMAPPKREDESKSEPKPAAPPPPPPPQMKPQVPPPTAPPQSAPVIQGPSVASGPVSSGSVDDAGEEEGGKGILIGVVVVGLFILLCLGIAVVGGGGYVLMGSSEEDASATNAVLEDIPIEADEEDEEEEEEEEAEPEEEEVKKETAPTRRSSSSSSRRSSSSRESSGSSSPSRRSSSQSTSSSTKPKPVSRTKPVTTTRKKAAPAPAPAAGGPVRVKFKVTGTGKMSCSNGTSRSIDGVATLTYQDYELPGYCRIDVSGQAACMATFDRSMTCTCKPGASEATCQ